MLTEKQLERKNSAVPEVGASLAAAICGLDPYRTPIAAQYEILALSEPFEGNAATDVGNRLEPVVLDYMEGELGKLRRGGERVCHDLVVQGCKILRVHPDGTVVESGRPAEAKTSGITGPSLEGFGDYWSSDIPITYRIQLHAQMIAFGADEGYLGALLGGKGFFIYVLKKNDQLHEVIRNRLAFFFEEYIFPYLNDGTLISPPDCNLSLNDLKRVKREPDSIAVLDEQQIDDVWRWDNARKARLSIEKGEDWLKARALTHLGTNESAKLGDKFELVYKPDKAGRRSPRIRKISDE